MLSLAICAVATGAIVTYRLTHGMAWHYVLIPIRDQWENRR